MLFDAEEVASAAPDAAVRFTVPRTFRLDFERQSAPNALRP
jgi:hypothetical protein